MIHQFNIFQKLLRMNWFLFFLMVAMAVGSIYFIDSATYLAEDPYLINAASKQKTWLILGLGAFFVMSLIDYDIFIKLGVFIYILCIALLLYVFFFGDVVNNAKSWIRLPGGFQLQPAEFCKLGFICSLAWFLNFQKENIKKFWVIIVATVAALIPVYLILKQPDLGSASVFLPIAFFMLFAAGARISILSLPVIAAVSLLVFCYVYVHKMNQPLPGLKEYQNKRIKTFFDPSQDPRGAGWTIGQSLIAVGSGGVKGKGYKEGDQNNYGFLPKKISYNDFIFAVIAEEFGFIGGTLMIVAHGILLIGIITIAQRSKDLGGALLATGVASMFFTHFFINIGMTINVVPITGIPLPFTSYGGTFLLACMAGMGILQSVWIHRREY